MWTNDSYGRRPEPLPITLIVEHDIAGSYEFDTVRVWKHDETGALYWAHDSGCSCPTPFEFIDTLADLETGSWHDLQRWLHEVWPDDHYRGNPPTERHEVLMDANPV